MYSFLKNGISLFYAERELAGAKTFYFLLYAELENGETYNGHLVSCELAKYHITHITHCSALNNIKHNFKLFYNVRKSILMICRNKVLKLIQLVDLMNIKNVIILLYLIKSRIKKIIKNFIILRAKICTYITIISSAGSREVYSIIETRNVVKIKNVKLKIHTKTATQCDHVKPSVNCNKLAISTRSEATAGAAAREMTPLVEGVSAGASRRLARWPMVGRPSETRGYKRGRRGSSRAQCATNIPCINIGRK